MENLKEFYILGQPIETKIGNLHFIKVKEYLSFCEYIKFLVLNKEDVLKFVKLLHGENDDVKTFEEYLKDISLLDLIRDFKAIGLYETYKELFKFCFKEDVFDLISNNDEFTSYLDLIKDINYINIEKPNPNAEIEKFNLLKRMLQKKKSDAGDAITFESVYTSVWAIVGHKPDNMTLYQMYALFNRAMQIKAYDSTTLFATVAKDVKIESWYKHIDLLQKQVNGTKTNLKDLLNSQKQL